MSQYITKIRTDQGDKQIDYNALANLPTISNPNLLINGDFRNPVNQRGQTTYIAENAQTIYTIDRWRTKGLTVTVNSASITIKNNGNTVWGFIQKFEKPLPNSIYTISLKALSVTGTVNVRCTKSDDTYESQLGVTTGTSALTVTGDVSDVTFVLTAGSQIEVEWIKLEQGSSATLFTPRLYVEELALCQRYYVKSNGIRLPIINGTSSLFMTIPLTTTMRVIPTIIFSKTNIVIVRDNMATSLSCTIGANHVNMTSTHLILTIDSDYGSDVFQTGCVAEDFPIAFDAEIY